MMRKLCLRYLVALFSVAMVNAPTAAETPANPDDTQANAQRLKHFETEIRPLLASKCFDCHGAEKQKGGLRLDSLDAMLQGGDSGAAIVPGHPDESLLVQAIRYEAFEMPPTQPLSEREVATLSKWVELGALWPGSDPSATVKVRETFNEEDRQWWAIQPVKPPSVPAISGTQVVGSHAVGADLAVAELVVADSNRADIAGPKVVDPAVRNATWAKNAIDNFIFARMQAAGLSPADEAEPVALVRRLYFDVVGLPPTPAQAEEFVRDQTPGAYERLVEQLLDARGYGENAARQWLDLVRYADSDGYRADGYRPDAWRYRDYVIKAFNTDKPYDRFVQEQIAGDELFPSDLDAQVALGYLRNWVYEWNIRDAPGQWNTILEDVTDTTADVFMGLGLQCAKCHDHKFDPLLRKDYFRLRAFFSPLLPNTTLVATNLQRSEFATQFAAWQAKVGPLQAEIDAIEAPYRETLKNRAIDRFPEDIQTLVRLPATARKPAEIQLAHLVLLQVEAEYKGLESELKAADKDRVLELRRKIEAFASERPAALPTAMTVADVGPTAPPTTIPKRVNEFIEPGFPTIINAAPAEIPALTSDARSTGRRAALAQWLTRPDNPLTTRVIVNRVWQSHFGRGLAANPSDFGRLGEPPTHPELLDWLTTKFVQEGWSLKALHRLILNSATYRQSTAHKFAAEYQTLDPLNKFYWRSDTRRLPAEKIRDAILAVTGQLNERSGGPSATLDVPCRTIFTRVMRNAPDELLDSFDLPLFFSSNSSRNTTTTPVQSLLLINSNLMLSHARNLALTVTSGSAILEEQIDEAWRRVYGRSASANEVNEAREFIAAQTRLIAHQRAEQGSQIIETDKLPYRTGQAVRFVAEKPDLHLSVLHADTLDFADFTVETFFQLRSVDPGATVRTLLGKWNGDIQQPGWAFGVTGQGSRRKPQTMVLQLVGQRLDGSTGERALFSDQHIDIAKPYYVAASVRLARDGKPGIVSFYLKDLSNDDEPLLTSVVEHDIVGNIANKLPMTIGFVSGDRQRPFDGLIDDTRLVAKQLTVDQILYSSERMVPETIGLWQFETDPGVTRNSMADRPHLSAQGRSVVQLSPAEAALVDFCHALLNSNGFLYVH